MPFFRTYFRTCLLIVLCAVVCIPVVSFAGDIPPSEVNFGLSNVDSSIGLSNDVSIIEIITNIIRVILGLLGIIVVGLMLYAGFMWMTAAGNDEKIATAKKIMTNAVIGLAIILSSFAITQFVIRSLSDATGSGTFGDDSSISGCTTEDGCSPVFCNRNGFNSVCTDQTFYIKSITPSTEDTDSDSATFMNNAVVRVVFSRPVASSMIDEAVVVRDSSNDVVQTQITGRHGNRVLEVRPTSNDGMWQIGAYSIEVDRDIEDYQGGSLETTNVRGVSYPRQTEFYINRLYEDTAQPEILALTINGADTPEVLFVGDVLTIDLEATDRNAIPEGLAHAVGGIGYASIDVRTGSRSIYTHYVGPRVRESNSGGSSDTFVSEYIQTITASDFPTGASYSVVATVYDIDGNQRSITRTFVVYPASCNNGILDPGETAVDEGGPCGSEEGGLCSEDSDCSPYMECSSTGICVANPIILDFDPKDAASQNWVTVFGRYFGATAGTVSFGYPNGADYTWIEAAFPSRAECPVGDIWTSTWTIVAVPPELPERDDIAIRITRAPRSGETNAPFDTTIDDRGTTDQFEKNNTERPGLCSVVSLETGLSTGAPREAVSLSGRGFIDNTTEIYWGSRVGSMTSYSSSALIESIVPQEFGNGVIGVRVQNDGINSNGVPFIVRTERNASDPVISYITPVTTTQGSYITLVGSGFGQPYGAVYLAGTAEQVLSCAAGNASAETTCYTLTVDLPNRCGVTWSGGEVVVAMTDALVERSIPSGTYALALKTIGGLVTSGTDTITLVDGPPQPSICKLTPNSGPAPLAAGETVRIIGSNFGSTTGSVRFWDTDAPLSEVTNEWLRANSDVDSFDELSLYTDTQIETIFPTKLNGLTIPVGVAVPIVVETVSGLFSNAVSYTANVCTADTPLDEEQFQCCLAGPEAGQIKPAAYACEGETKTAGYTWRLSSGILPRVPRVLEQCYPASTDVDTAVPPSPSPSTLWPESGTSACINARVAVQFSLDTIDAATVNMNTVRMYKCENGQRRGCTETNIANPSLTNGQTLVIYEGSDTPLDADTWYTVEIDREVQSLELVDIAGREDIPQRQNLLPTRPCGDGTAYCFDFKTSAFGDICTMVDAFIVPRIKTIRELGPVEMRPGSLLPFEVWGEANQACISINAQGIGWDWNAVDSESEEIADDLDNNGQFEIDYIEQRWDHIRTLIALIELPNQPLTLRASTTTEESTITGESTITIALGDPEVTTYWPNCIAACSNATLGVRFNRVMMRRDFTESNVRVYQCSDRACTSDRILIGVSIETNDSADRGFEIIPESSLMRDTWYRVELRDMHAIGGYTRNTEGILVPIQGDVIDPFVWGFKTKASFDGCFVDSVDISPSSYLARFIGERTAFSVIPFGTPDQCSPYGQRLNPFDYDWAWSIPLTPESYRDVVEVTANSIAPVSAPGCTTNCTPMGSDRLRTQDITSLYSCGNGQLDPGEACDIGMTGEVAGRSGQEEPYTCSYSCQRPGNGSAGEEAGQCGNGEIDNPINLSEGVSQNVITNNSDFEVGDYSGWLSIYADSEATLSTGLDGSIYSGIVGFDRNNLMSQMIMLEKDSKYRLSFQYKSESAEFIGKKGYIDLSFVDGGGYITRQEFVLSGEWTTFQLNFNTDNADDGLFVAPFGGNARGYLSFSAGSGTIDQNSRFYLDNVKIVKLTTVQAGEACDAGSLNGQPNSGCSATCTLTGSSATFSGDLAAPFCSISEGVFDGAIDAGESCEINSAGQLVLRVGASDSVAISVPDPKSYCTDTCTLRGSALAQSWCDVGDRNATIPECRSAISICGNGVVESGETCEVLVRGTVTSSLRVLTDANRANKFEHIDIVVASEDVASICTPACLLGNICEYEDIFISDAELPITNIWCDPNEGEGCTAGCTLAGSSLEYTFLSQCRDNVVGTGEYTMCEVPIDGALFAAPTQIATAKGESTVVNPVTRVQESRITVATTRFMGVDDAGEPVIEDIATGDVITAEAPYLLQCGYEEYDTPDIITLADETEVIAYNGCPNSTNGFDAGVATNSCCYDRPAVSDTYPEVNAINVCRNTLLEVSFADEVIEKASLQNNILLAMHVPFTDEDRAAAEDGVPLPSCAEQGLEDVTDIVVGTIGSAADAPVIITMNFFERVWHTITSVLARLVETVFTYDTDASQFVGLDGVWCDASIALTTAVFYEANAAGTSGTSSIRLNISRLLDANTVYTLLLRSGSNGIKNAAGVSMQPTDQTTIYFGVPFKTSEEICKIDRISVSPEAYVFQSPGQEQEFVLETYNGRGERVVPITGVYDWRYSWAPSLSELFVIPVDSFVSTSEFGILASRDIEADQTAQGRVQIITDIATDLGDQTDRFFTATTDLYARFCANLWGDPLVTERWLPFKNDVYNFSFWYCADAGLGSTTDDDLPLFNTLRDTSPDRSDDDAIIERTFFFNSSSFNDDAFGIQIFLNPNRYSARDWYTDHFGAEPNGFQVVTIDGYDAITNGNTYYINALNIAYSDDPIPMVDNLYSNIYQFSINEGAREDTQRAFAEIMRNLRFNTNMTDYGYCLESEPSRRSRTEVINSALSCTTDFDCRTNNGSPKDGTSGVCSNNRTALFRDLERIEDLNTIQYRLETEGRNNVAGTYPALASGTFYPGYTMSRWPSWGRFVGGIPNDPINRWTACGDPLSTDQQTCWDPSDSLYYCPAESSVYEYAVNSITNEYTLHAQFEFLERSDAIFGDLLGDSSSVSTTPWCEPNTTSSPFGNTCGDGIVQPGEECDPPGRRSNAISCDIDGGTYNGVQFRTCTASCTYGAPTACVATATCGNGIVEGVEQCDAGDRNGLYGVGCTAPDADGVGGCQIDGALYCGNGVLDRGLDGTYYEFCEEVDGICQFVFDDVTKIEPMLYFLVDSSGSMGNSYTLEGGTTTTRWNIITSNDGLPRVFNELKDKTLTALGVFSTNNSQLVDMRFTDSVQVTELITDLRGVTTAGSTYLGKAISDRIFVGDSSTIFNTGNPIDGQRPKSLVLIIDGTANDASLVQTNIERLRNEFGIFTYVIGVGATHNNFDLWAAAGGSNKHFRVDNANELLGTIRNLTRCYSYSLRPGNTCNDSCTGFGSYCGDGIVQSEQGETCDDGNYINGDGCDTYCRLETAAPSVTPVSPTGTCGDGLVQTPNNNGVREACDLGSQNGIAPPGIYGERQTYCSADCTAVLTVDQAGYCGDGIVQPEEVCDGLATGDIFGGICSNSSDGAVTPYVFCSTDAQCDTYGGLCIRTLFGDPIRLTCSDVGSYTCTNSCQTLVNNCVSCDIHSTPLENGDRNPAIDRLPKLDIRFLNPLGQHEDDRDATNNIFLNASGLKWKLLGVTSEVGRSVPGVNGVSITRQANMDNAYYYTQPDYYIESNDQCTQYEVAFVYGTYDQNNYTQANRFPFVVNNELNRIEQVYTVSPALPPNNIRIVVRWEDYGTDSRPPRFKGGVYASELDPKLIVAGAIDASDLCSEQMRNPAGYYVPTSCTAFNNSIYYSRRVLDYAHPRNGNGVPGNGVQGITIDINALSSRISLGRKVAYFVQPDSGVIAPYQRDGKVHVDVYTHRTLQRTDGLYVPTYSFALDSAELSSNDIAAVWHAFNLVKVGSTMQIELLDTARTKLPLTGIDTSATTLTPNVLHGKVKTRFCEVQEDADRLPRGELCNP